MTINMYSPKFTINSAILKYIGKIEASKEIIENAPLVPAYEAKFRQEAIIRTVHHGTHIEGNELDTGEVAAVLAAGPEGLGPGGKDIGIDARDRDIQEVLNYRNVLKFIDKSKNKKAKFSEKDLLAIHKLTVEKVLRADASGKFRSTQVVVKNSKTGEVSFSPPKAGDVKDLVGEFLDWLNSTDGQETHPVIKAGIVHYVLAFIHPFVDGNGRTARAFATMVLFAEGYDIKKFFSLEEFFDKNAPRYYKTLQSVSNQKVDSLSERELTPWLEYFCEGLAEELSRVKEKVQKLSLDLRMKGRTGQIALSERQLKLVEYIEQYGSVSNKQWRSLLRDYSDDTILRDLKDLQKKGLIKKKGSTKGAVYILK
ncbi:MAG: Fic family protein [Candidatus Curtissbacteria bacterium]|nr:Fic family protein [Candidatus Curtissbacteria bacterium]